MTPWRRRLRRLRLWVTFTCAALIIVAAVLMALVQVLLPQIAAHPQRVAAFLAERLQRLVSIDKVHGEWSGSGPVLRLEGVHIAASDVAAPPLVIPEAEIALDFFAWARSNRRWSEFRLIGLDLTVQRGADGAWSVSGLSGGNAAANDDNPLLMLGALVLRDTRVRVVDAGQALDVAVRADELRLLNWGEEHRLLGLVRRDGSRNPPLELVVEYDGAARDGRLYVGARNLDFAELLGGVALRGLRLGAGKGRVQAWAEYRAGRFESAHLAVDLDGVGVSPASATPDAPVPAAWSLAHVAGTARWRRDGDGWRFDIANLRAAREGRDPPESQLSVVRGVDAAGSPEYRATSQQLDLSTLAALAALPGLASDGLRDWLAEATPRGQLVDVVARCGGDCAQDDYDVAATLSDLSLASVGKKPGIDRLDAQILGDAGAIVVSVPPQATVVRYPRKFREPFVLSRFGGDIAAFRIDDGWRVETDALDLDGNGYALQLRGGVELPTDGTKPLLDLYALVAYADVRATRYFLPIGDMGPNGMNWLDQGLIEGRIDLGRAAIHGDLDDWPFRNLAGRFDARAEISGLTLDYSPGKWPRAKDVVAVAEFVNNGMRVEAANGSVLGAQAKRAVAVIADFKDSVLELDVEGEGGGPELLAVLNDSPVGRRYADELAGIAIGGRGALKFRLDLPLKPDVPGKIRGEVDLADARLEAKKWNIDFAGANGKLRFDDGGFVGGPFAVKYKNHPAQFTVAVGDGTSDRANAVEAKLQGNLPMSVVFADFQTLNAWWPKFPGSSDWTATVAIPRPDAAQKATTLRLRSELRGTAFQLPAPLDKPEGDALPIDIALHLPVEGSPLTIELGDVLRIRGRLPAPNRTFAATIGLGDTMPETVPATGIGVGGRADRLDLSGWGALSIGAGPDLVGNLDVAAQTMRIGGADFKDVGFKIDRKPDVVSFVFTGPTIEGTVQVPPTAEIVKRGITAQLARLHWPESPKPKPGTEETDPLDGVVPSTIPPLHILIGDFRLGTAAFGETRLESVPTADGMRIDQFDTHSPALQIHARGEWTGDGRKHTSRIDMDLTAEDIGRMLASLGFTGLFDGGQTLAHIDASWPGSPATFSPSRLDGKLKLNVNAGRVLDVEPGMGRLFGLFSVREIPRRLSLDFGDFFKSGMSFTAITGEFELRDGSAFTQNLHIASPAADIRINGRTGLKARDYDQQMVVTPHVGGTFTVVGALAGGPAGAAAGLAVQTLFNKAINQVTSARYHVGGSWEKPDIKLISKEGGRKRKSQG